MSAPLSVVAFARISAWLADGSLTLDEALSRENASRDQWVPTQVHWNRVFMEELADDVDDAARAYAEAFADAQRELGPPPGRTLTIEEWARLSVAHARDGAEALRQWGIGPGEHLRLHRFFADLFASDPREARRYAAAFAAASKP